MLICGLDLETTGLDKDGDEITEIAWVIKKWRDPKPLVCKTYFTRVTKPIPEEITKLTSIRDWHLDMQAVDLKDAVGDLIQDMMDTDCAYIMAHNGEAFDRPFLMKKLDQGEIRFPEYHWLDSKTDCRWEFQSRKLSYLACEYGFLNPFPHAALFDVMTMFKCAEHFEIEDIVRRANEADVYVVANVNYHDRQLAKDAGFRWEKADDYRTFTKQWVKLIKESDLAELQKNCSFSTEVAATRVRN